ncbi:hypothetical protein [Microbacterium sp. G2-8]|uniref:hypothetical protein n=1 Tax=Microbacterium sp. G2-8 TaxID=2842454 RepID=UPI001C89E459|nr:hypothetical protein [Microbacterium sp. G2-8]
MTWIQEAVRTIALGEWAFELLDDDVADIRFRGRTVLRSVRAVARDRDWATAEWAVDGVEVGEADARIALSSSSFGADLHTALTITARGPELTVSLEATTARAFLTNRTGLVVLQPPSLAGDPLEIRHSDGSAERTAFPADIAPHQPAFDIAGLAWSDVRLEFDGDTFEMEDQRNWTDASFKTYSRPLALPFPYELAAGSVVRQSVTVSVDPAGGARAETLAIARDADDSGGSSPFSTNVQTLDALTFVDSGVMPAVSVGASTAPGAPPVLDPIGSELLVELDLGWGGWPAALARAAASGLPLDVRLVLPEDDAPARAADAVRALAPHAIARITAFQPAGHEAQHVSDAGAVRILRNALENAGLDVPVLGGARSHFTEVNREQHRIPSDVDGFAFSTTPLFHTRETRQLEEAVAMQRLVAAQAGRIANGRPVHVGPVSLRTHVNNVATTAPPRPDVDDLSEGYGPALLDADDPRQAEPELAAWTIASAAALAVPGVASISFFEEWGPRGVRTAEGDDLPVAAAIHALAGLAGCPIATAHTPDGKVWAIRSDDAMLVANLDATERVGLPPHGWHAVSR